MTVSPDEDMLQCVRDHFLCGFTLDETIQDMFGTNFTPDKMVEEHYLFVQAIFVFSILGIVADGERNIRYG